MRIACGCNSFTCTERISAPLEDLEEATANGQVIIAASCAHGAEATDTLIEEKNGYSIYKEG